MNNRHDGYDVDAVAFLGQLDLSDEVRVTPGRRYMVRTENGSVYVNGEDGVAFHGSTFGGSMLAIDRLIRGAHLEFSKHGKVYVTSPIASITVGDQP